MLDDDVTLCGEKNPPSRALTTRSAISNSQHVEQNMKTQLEALFAKNSRLRCRHLTPHMLPSILSRSFGSLLNQSLSSPNALWIQIRPLAQTNSPLTSTGPIIIICCSVIHRAIVPDGKIIRVGPSVSNLEIVV